MAGSILASDVVQPDPQPVARDGPWQAGRGMVHNTTEAWGRPGTTNRIQDQNTWWCPTCSTGATFH